MQLLFLTEEKKESKQQEGKAEPFLDVVLPALVFPGNWQQEILQSFGSNIALILHV